MHNNKVEVWDILVRLFHWSLVLSFAIAYITEEGIWHIYAGYTVLGLIIFRVIWGLVGSPYARFSQFVYSPNAVITYLKDLYEHKSKRYMGHNPAGGVMIVVLLLSLFVVTISGLKLYAIEDNAGPLANMPAISLINTAQADEKHSQYEEEGDEEFWEELHETSANVMILLILLHILGVVVAGKLHKENLIKAMITGKKKSE